MEPELKLRGDPRLLRLALEHLLGNAWKFTRGNEVAKIFFGRARDGGMPAFCVSDNGVGFDAKYADRLFRPFQRLHSQSEFEGAGMGLATLQRVLHAHGGRIWATGQPGAGASFYFVLPGMSGTTNASTTSGG